MSKQTSPNKLSSQFPDPLDFRGEHHLASPTTHTRPFQTLSAPSSFPVLNSSTLGSSVLILTSLSTPHFQHTGYLITSRPPTLSIFSLSFQPFLTSLLDQCLPKPQKLINASTWAQVWLWQHQLRKTQSLVRSRSFLYSYTWRTWHNKRERTNGCDDMFMVSNLMQTLIMLLCRHSLSQLRRNHFKLLPASSMPWVAILLISFDRWLKF